MIARLLRIMAWSAFLAFPAYAQSSFVTPGGSVVDGKVVMCLNGSNQAVPCSSATPLQTSGGGGGGSVTQGTTPWVDSITTWGGGTLGAMANYGTSPGAVLVPGVNAFITNTSLPLMTGAATSANQSSEIGFLTTIASNTSSPITACATNPCTTVIGAVYLTPDTPFSINGLKATVTAVKSSAAGALCSLELYNLDTSVEYIQVFDVATAGAVTLGTTTPRHSYPVPASGWYAASIPAQCESFVNGIQIAVTTTYGGSTAPTNGFVVNGSFQ